MCNIFRRVMNIGCFLETVWFWLGSNAEDPGTDHDNIIRYGRPIQILRAGTFDVRGRRPRALFRTGRSLPQTSSDWSRLVVDSLPR